MPHLRECITHNCADTNGKTDLIHWVFLNFFIHVLKCKENYEKYVENIIWSAYKMNRNIFCSHSTLFCHVDWLNGHPVYINFPFFYVFKFCLFLVVCFNLDFLVFLFFCFCFCFFAFFFFFFLFLFYVLNTLK